MRHDPETWHRLSMDVARLGVAQACRIHGIHRSTWYRRASAKTAPIPMDDRREELLEAILRICRERPVWGCDRIAYFLGLEGVRVSSPTVQKILIAKGLGSRNSREEWARTAHAASPAQREV